MDNRSDERMLETLGYGSKVEIEADFDEAVERVKRTLADEGFGVLAEIRIDEKLREKLGVDFRRYVILGACNPPLAYKALQGDINIGLLLPCNVVVYEGDGAGQTVIAAIDAGKVLSVAEDKGLASVAGEVNERLRRALVRTQN